MKTWMALAAVLWVPAAHAQDARAVPPDLPPTRSVQRWLDQDAGVREALGSRSASANAAGRLRASPYEWSLSFSPQMRNYSTGSGSREWIGQLMAPVRLPRKARLDGDLADVELQMGDARLGEARHEAARELLDLWMDWLAAVHRREWIAQQLELAKQNLAAVQTRQRAGDASDLDVNVASSDLAAAERDWALAGAEAGKTASRLRIRFPEAGGTPPELSEPTPVSEAQSELRERVLAKADDLRLAQLQVARAERRGERARAERIPDPTLMFYMASEARGDERVMGMNVNIPLPMPGGPRFRQLDEAMDQLAVAKAALQRAQRAREIEITDAYLEATTAFQSWQLAEQAHIQGQESARLAQRAYEFGEGEIQTLLLARRQSAEAAAAALESRVSALRARYRLFVDAHWIWGLDHEEEE